jgi:4a-hydroxytetrahydrobiopterin dehydratase
MKTLQQNELKALRIRLPEWTRRGGVIRRTYAFSGFPAAMRFVNAVARAAEAAQHHPDIDIRWNRVRLALTTHDAGGLTQRDADLAAACDVLAVRTDRRGRP